MAQHRRDAPADTLEQLESIGDRLMRWVAANPALVLGLAGAILAAAAAFGGIRAWRQSQADAVSAAFSKIQTEFVVAMGGGATDVEAPEPANPETARQLRTEYVEKFLVLAREHPGDPTAALARLQASELYEALGAPEQALDALRDGLDALPRDSVVRGVVQARIATLLEAAGDFEAAAKAYEAAASVTGYPLGNDALANAARCFAEAGKRDEAVAIYGRLQAEAPDLRLPPHVEARLRELQAQR